jgi:hypothetical protein
MRLFAEWEMRLRRGDGGMKEKGGESVSEMSLRICGEVSWMREQLLWSHEAHQEIQGI